MNLYTSPEKYGLTVVGEVHYISGYEFDIVAVYRDQKGRLGYVKDDGCSCPIPFDGMGADDLTYCTPAELQAVLEERAKVNTWTETEGRFSEEIAELMSRVVS